MCYWIWSYFLLFGIIRVAFLISESSGEIWNIHRNCTVRFCPNFGEHKSFSKSYYSWFQYLLTSLLFQTTHKKFNSHILLIWDFYEKFSHNQQLKVHSAGNFRHLLFLSIVICNLDDTSLRRWRIKRRGESVLTESLTITLNPSTKEIRTTVILRYSLLRISPILISFGFGQNEIYRTCVCLFFFFFENVQDSIKLYKIFTFSIVTCTHRECGRPIVHN